MMSPHEHDFDIVVGISNYSVTSKGFMLKDI